jgi:hypothetical protein
MAARSRLSSKLVALLLQRSYHSSSLEGHKQEEAEIPEET